VVTVSGIVAAVVVVAPAVCVTPWRALKLARLARTALPRRPQHLSVVNTPAIAAALLVAAPTHRMKPSRAIDLATLESKAH